VRRTIVGSSFVVLGLALAIFAVGALAMVDDGAGAGRGAGSTPPVVARPGDVGALQERLRQVPNDDVAWASLGLAYLEKAKATANPELYPKAEGALRRSLALRETDNFVAAAGMAALANARHDFAGAREWALQGLAVNPFNATLHGTLADADTQLGNYPKAWEATQRMVDLSPDTASLSRVSYSWELRGDVAQARALMERALGNALNPSQKAFARYHLGDLALVAGDPAAALAHYEAGVVADPSYAALLEGRARAQLALGRTDAAVADMAKAVARIPEPGYVLLYGELLESLGRTAEAEQQYEVFRAEQRLFEANGVVVDVEAALFEADHGDPARAVEVAESGLRSRPFIEMEAAYAWALHRAGRDVEASAAIGRARSLGTKNPLFEFRTGMIERSLGNLEAARRHLSTALAMNPAFHPLHAPAARAALAEMTPR
jgi:tetratricopeptide (TPR) repeat protein